MAVTDFADGIETGLNNIQDDLLAHDPTLDGDGRPRAYAFVAYSTPAEATAALKGLPGQMLNGQPLGVRKPSPDKHKGPEDRFAPSGRPGNALGVP